MADELYVNKNGWKCVRTQLAKTDGRDPQMHAAVMQRYTSVPVEDRDAAWAAARKAELATLPVKEPQYEEKP